MVRCPKCNSDEIELKIHQEEGFAEAEVYCLHCEDTVAFYRIADEDWIAED